MKGKLPNKGVKNTRRCVTSVKPKVVKKVRNEVRSNRKSKSPSSDATSGIFSTSGESTSSSDLSERNFPYDIRFNGVTSLLNIINKSTSSVKDLFMDECEIILECRVCRNLFRSFPNFLCHKQQFCKQLYNPATQSKYGPLVQCAENLYQLQYQIDASLKHSSTITTANTRKKKDIALDQRKKRLDNILTKLKETDNVAESCNKNSKKADCAIGASKRKCGSPVKGRNSNFSSAQNISLSIEPLLNRAQDGIIFQHLISTDNEEGCDKRFCQKDDTAVLGLDGKMIYLGAEKGATNFLNQVTTLYEDDDDESDNNLSSLQCSMCQTQFYSPKTLRLHARKANCTPIGRNSEILDQSKRKLMDLTDSSLKAQKYLPSPVRNSKISINPSPVKNLIVKRKATNNRTDYNTAKENKNIIKAIFAPKKSSKQVFSLKNHKRQETRKKIETSVTYERPPDSRNPNQSSSALNLGFTCIQCSSCFATKSEMSSHLAMCTGVINLAFQRSLLAPEPKKICIQIRHNYEKEQPLRPTPECSQPKEASQASEPNAYFQCTSTVDTNSKSSTNHFNNNLNETMLKEDECLLRDNIHNELFTKVVAEEKAQEFVSS